MRCPPSLPEPTAELVRGGTETELLRVHLQVVKRFAQSESTKQMKKGTVVERSL